MTEQEFETILENQVPDHEKRARSDYVIWTNTIDDAQKQVQDIVSRVRSAINHA